MPATELDIQGLKVKALESFYFFTKGILGYDWLTPEIHKPICDELQKDENIRVLIELPRGWLKTTICSVAFPIWMSVRNPNIRCLLTQNSATNACKKLSVVRKQWENNPILRACFRDLLPSQASTWTADALCLSRSASFAESTYEAAGTSTRVVSRHYDLIIEDDTVAPDYDELGDESLAPTHDEVQKAIGWHRMNVLPLLNNPSKDRSLVVGTRWYDQDLIAWIKENEPQYKVISRACREDEFGKPSHKGKVTYPERFNEDTLAQLERGLGPYLFSCLYMNTPVRSEDMIFKPEWFRFYEEVPSSTRLAVYTTIDPATDPELAKSKDIDFNVVMTCGKDLITGDIYVLDYFHKRCSPGELAAAIFDHVVKWSPIVVGYENIAYQRSIEYWLKELMRQHNTFFILEPLNRGGARAKETAISSLQPLFASRTIAIRSHMKELQSELLKFPLGKHDDLADALSMQLRLWRGTKSKRQERQYNTLEPLSFEQMVKELKAKARPEPFASPVFDPMHYSGTYGIPRIAT